ncbi:hypothetical protein KC19_2G006400 [Ceratodon purpureus]|uniref:Uncharacterized protein n=1 Tax=Ceratodon purpureus TaxID=3225 RepID=A0A8T0IQS7_CERPU|nr:hypothetical protein KC19_2G006400 [Ceratodon purpureus]
MCSADHIGTCLRMYVMPQAVLYNSNSLPFFPPSLPSPLPPFPSGSQTPEPSPTLTLPTYGGEGEGRGRGREQTLCPPPFPSLPPNLGMGMHMHMHAHGNAYPCSGDCRCPGSPGSAPPLTESRSHE